MGRLVAQWNERAEVSMPRRRIWERNSPLSSLITVEAGVPIGGGTSSTVSTVTRAVDKIGSRQTIDMNITYVPQLPRRPP